MSLETHPASGDAIGHGITERGDVIRPETDHWVPVLANVGMLAKHIANTEFVPKGLRNNIPATTAAILYGREVGLPPMTALTHTSVVDGRPTLSSEAMRALILAAGHEIHFEETTGARCVMRGRRIGSEEWTTVTWDMGMAKAARLDGKDNWRKYPRAMLQARATAELARLIFPDVTHGLTVAEEASDERESTRATKKARKVERRPSTGRLEPDQSGQLESTDPRPPVAPPPEGKGRGNVPGSAGEMELPAESGASSWDAGESESGETSDGSPRTGDRGTNEPDPASEPDGGGERTPTTTRSSPPLPITTGQRAAIFAQFKRLKITTKEAQLEVLSGLCNRPVDSRSKLTQEEASGAIETLGRVASAGDLRTLILNSAEALAADELGAEPVDEEEPPPEEES